MPVRIDGRENSPKENILILTRKQFSSRSNAQILREMDLTE